MSSSEQPVCVSSEVSLILYVTCSTYKLYESTTNAEPHAPIYLRQKEGTPQNASTLSTDIPQSSFEHFFPGASKEDPAQSSQTPCTAPSELTTSPKVPLYLTSTVPDHLEPASVNESPSSRPKRKYRTPAERKAFLLSDPLITHVEPERVYCSLCKIWVNSKEKRGYNVTEWFAHCQSRKQ